MIKLDDKPTLPSPLPENSLMEGSQANSSEACHVVVKNWTDSRGQAARHLDLEVNICLPHIQ